MPGAVWGPMRRRPIDEEGRALVEGFLRARFPGWVPSPIKEILSVRRLGGHFGARIILFDDVPCLLIVGNGPAFGGEDRWIFRGLPAASDTRPFFFHRMRSAWIRADGSRRETRERHRRNFV